MGIACMYSGKKAIVVDESDLEDDDDDDDEDGDDNSTYISDDEEVLEMVRTVRCAHIFMYLCMYVFMLTYIMLL